MLPRLFATVTPSSLLSSFAVASTLGAAGGGGNPQAAALDAGVGGGAGPPSNAAANPASDPAVTGAFPPSAFEADAGEGSDSGGGGGFDAGIGGGEEVEVIPSGGGNDPALIKSYTVTNVVDITADDDDGDYGRDEEGVVVVGGGINVLIGGGEEVDVIPSGGGNDPSLIKTNNLTDAVDMADDGDGDDERGLGDGRDEEEKANDALEAKSNEEEEATAGSATEDDAHSEADSVVGDRGGEASVAAAAIPPPQNETGGSDARHTGTAVEARSGDERTAAGAVPSADDARAAGGTAGTDDGSAGARRGDNSDGAPEEGEVSPPSEEEREEAAAATASEGGDGGSESGGGASNPEPKEEESDEGGGDNDGPRERLLVDYASKSAGAQILEKSPSMKGTSNLLTEDSDRYAIAPCSDKKYVVVGLSEDILVKKIKLSNYERYSSHVKDFQVLASQEYPADHDRHWTDLGTYRAVFKSGEQAFELEEPAWARYLKFRFVGHYGAEYYCTISQIKVHGSTMLQGFNEQWAEREKMEEEERENMRKEEEDEEEEEERRKLEQVDDDDDGGENEKEEVEGSEEASADHGSEEEEDSTAQPTGASSDEELGVQQAAEETAENDVPMTPDVKSLSGVDVSSGSEDGSEFARGGESASSSGGDAAASTKPGRRNVTTGNGGSSRGSDDDKTLESRDGDGRENVISHGSAHDEGDTASAPISDDDHSENRNRSAKDGDAANGAPSNDAAAGAATDRLNTTTDDGGSSRGPETDETQEPRDDEGRENVTTHDEDDAANVSSSCIDDDHNENCSAKDGDATKGLPSNDEPASPVERNEDGSTEERTETTKSSSPSSTMNNSSIAASVTDAVKSRVTETAMDAIKIVKEAASSVQVKGAVDEIKKIIRTSIGGGNADDGGGGGGDPTAMGTNANASADDGGAGSEAATKSLVSNGNGGGGSASSDRRDLSSSKGTERGGDADKNVALSKRNESVVPDAQHVRDGTSREEAGEIPEAKQTTNASVATAGTTAGGASDETKAAAENETKRLPVVKHIDTSSLEDGAKATAQDARKEETKAGEQRARAEDTKPTKERTRKDETKPAMHPTTRKEDIKPAKQQARKNEIKPETEQVKKEDARPAIQHARKEMNGAESGELLAKLAERFPSRVSCIKDLDFKTFKKKLLAGGTGLGTPNGAGSGGHAKMEPIFAKITNEIKSVQLSQAQYQQYVSMVKSCYEGVLWDVVNDVDALRASQDLRLSSLESAMMEMRTGGGRDVTLHEQGALIASGVYSFAASVLHLLRDSEFGSTNTYAAAIGGIVLLSLISWARRRNTKTPKREQRPPGAFSSAISKSTEIPELPPPVEIVRNTSSSSVVVNGTASIPVKIAAKRRNSLNTPKLEHELSFDRTVTSKLSSNYSKSACRSATPPSPSPPSIQSTSSKKFGSPRKRFRTKKRV